MVFRLFLIGIIIFNNSAFCQTQNYSKTKKIDVEISGGLNGNLFTSGSNLIILNTKNTTDSFIVTTSQGITWPLDKYMYFVDSLKMGKTTISVFKKQNGNPIYLSKKTFNVLTPKNVIKYNALPISPGISLGGFTHGKISLDILKRISFIAINNNYKILRATFYIGQTDLSICTINSNIFDEHLKELWKRLVPNCNITIDNIEFIDKAGNRYFYPKQINLLAVE